MLRKIQAEAREFASYKKGQILLALETIAKNSTIPAIT